MRNQVDIRSMFFGALLGAVALLALGATGSRNPSWEYETYSGHLERPEAKEAINHMGSEGWELVTSHNQDETATLIFIRRR